MSYFLNNEFWNTANAKDAYKQGKKNRFSTFQDILDHFQTQLAEVKIGQFQCFHSEEMNDFQFSAENQTTNEDSR